MKKPAKYVLLLIMAVPAFGCGERWYGGVDEYMARVSRVFDAEKSHASWVINEALRYPSRRSLKLETPIASIGMLDFLRISDCDLQRLVGYRNSGLGKVMSDSQLLIYTLEFIELSDKCLSSGRVPSDLIDPLTDLIMKRKEAMGAYIWNSTFASKEFAAFFSLSSHRDPSRQNQLPAELLQALIAIRELAKTHRADKLLGVLLDDIESWLKVVSESEYAGALVLQQYLLAENLAQTEVQLKLAWTEAPLCRRGENNKLLFSPAKEIAVRHVFYHFYIDVVQQKATNLLRQSIQLNLLVAEIFRELGVASESFDRYWQGVWGLNGLAQGNLEGAMDRHTLFWQQVFLECNMSVGESK